MPNTPLNDFLAAGAPATQWRKQGNRWIMPELQSEFLDWLLSLHSERVEKTEIDWARTHGVAATTPASWKRNDRFRVEWAKRAAAKNVSVDRLQMILDMLFEKAIEDGDAQAARQWLTWVERYMPPVTVERDEEAANLSDEELAAELRELLDDDE